MKKKSLIFLMLALVLSLCLALVACADKNGGVNKLTAESGITLDGAFESGSALKAEHHTSDSEQGKAAIAAIDKPYDSAKIAVFDISVSKNGEKIQPNGKVKVTMPKPFESDGYVTYHVKDDNTIEELSTAVDGNNIYFETASFSYLVVAGLVNVDQQHIHSYVEKVTDRNLVDNATCQRKAVYRLVCSICGSLGRETFEYGELADHNLREEKGYNDTFVPPLGHDYEEIEVAPTCTEEGYRGKKCRRCEDCVKTEILKAVGHKFTDSYFIATCEDEGYTLHTCLSCGNEYKDNIVPATGHDYETEVVREPHCETEGERKFHCTKCEKEYYSDIPATGHNYELTGTEEVNGENIRTYVCTNCGAITTQNMGEQYEQVSSYIGYLFGQYQPYMWWVLLATAGVWSIVMGVFFAIAQKNEDKEKARKMIKNYVIGLVVIFVILVACPYLVKGIAALIAG